MTELSPPHDMDITPPIIVEVNLAEEIRDSILRCFPGWDRSTTRTDLSAALFSLALEHHASFGLLLADGKISSAFALMRPLIETCYRKVWIDILATDDDVKKIRAGRDAFPALSALTKDLERESSKRGMTAVFNRVQPHLRALNEQTHSGAAQVIRRLSMDRSHDQGYELMHVISNLRSITAVLFLAAVQSCLPDEVERITKEVKLRYPWLGDAAATV